MEIRHLRAFCTVAQEMHVTRAAKRLRMQQPALTQQLRLLEKDLGLQLVTRTGRGIALTEAGRFFHQEAEAFLSNLHNACLKAQELARGNYGLVRVGVTDRALFSPRLVKAFGQFRARYPEVKLTFSQRQSPDLARDLREELIDLAFLCRLPAPSALSTEVIDRHSLLLAVPATHRLARRKAVSLQELQNETFVVISNGNAQQSLELSFVEACAEAGFAPRILQTAPEFLLALNLVASGVALSLVPEHMTALGITSVRYLRLEPAVAGLTMETVMAAREHGTSSAVKNLHGLVSKAFEKQEGGGERKSTPRSSRKMASTVKRL